MTKIKLHEDCKAMSQIAYKENKPKNINNWNYVGSYSSNTSGYYCSVYKKDNKAILSIRGTDIECGKLESGKDLLSDFEMGLAALPRQTRDAKKVCKELIQKYGKENVIVTGHSLGGSLAQIIGTEYGIETVTFRALIYVEDYTRADGTKVSGYYRRLK